MTFFFIHYNADALLQWSCKSFPLKPVFDKPDMYLGVSCAGPGYTMEYGHGLWVPFVREAVRNYAAHLKANYDGKFRLPKKAENPLRWLWSRVGYHSWVGSRCSVLLLNNMDNWAWKDWHDNWGDIIVTPCSTPQRGTLRCSSACHDTCWSEISFQTGVWPFIPRNRLQFI